ncbi:MAG: hypothetical protein J6Y49_01450 [Alphaproteobacteria bacterium]|nr:hypothetical protein [Alphaproteobacteria bacterium]
MKKDKLGVTAALGESAMLLVAAGLMWFVITGPERERKKATWEDAKPDTLVVQDKQIASSIEGVATDVYYELLVQDTDGKQFVFPSRAFNLHYNVDYYNSSRAKEKSDIKFATPGDTLVMQRSFARYKGTTYNRNMTMRNITMQRRNKQH